MDDSEQAKEQAGAGKNGVVPPPEHRWQPGQSGNPGGRPKTKIFTDRIREVLEADNGKLRNEIVDALVKDLRTDADTRHKLLGEILNRTEGKVKDEIEHSGQLTSKVLILPPETPSPAITSSGPTLHIPAPPDEV